MIDFTQMQMVKNPDRKEMHLNFVSQESTLPEGIVPACELVDTYPTPEGITPTLGWTWDNAGALEWPFYTGPIQDGEIYAISTLASQPATDFNADVTKVVLSEPDLPTSSCAGRSGIDVMRFAFSAFMLICQQSGAGFSYNAIIRQVNKNSGIRLRVRLNAQISGSALFDDGNGGTVRLTGGVAQTGRTIEIYEDGTTNFGATYDPTDVHEWTNLSVSLTGFVTSVWREIQFGTVSTFTTSAGIIRIGSQVLEIPGSPTTPDPELWEQGSSPQIESVSYFDNRGHFLFENATNFYVAYLSESGDYPQINGITGAIENASVVGESFATYWSASQPNYNYLADIRTSLVYNFEDDNYTWMDASVVNVDQLDVVSSMKYGFEAGWATRWDTPELAGLTWDDFDAALEPWSLSAPTWANMSGGGKRQNMQWLTDDGLHLADRVVDTGGVKSYYVERTGIDLDDLVSEWTTNNWKHIRQFYFHIESELPDGFVAANPMDITMGWSTNLMDTPDYVDATTINLQDTSLDGKVKWDVRSTGRYLALRMDFDGTQKFTMTGGDVDAEVSHGR